MNRSLLIATAFSIALISCSESSNSDDQSKASGKESTEQSCTYSFNQDSTAIKWTAFKFTEKTGVGGKFDRYSITGTQASKNPLEVFKYAVVSIPVNTINSNDPERDRKIVQHFFGSMKGTPALNGQMVSIDEKSAAVALTMNGVTDNINLKVVREDALITLSGTIDMNTWNAQSSIDSLNVICHDLHIGVDGVSKLWSEVDLEIAALLSKNCK